MKKLLELCRTIRCRDALAKKSVCDARNEAHKHASVMALLKKGPKVCTEPEVIREYLPDGMWPWTRSWTRRVTGGIRGAVRRIREGEVALDDKIWSADFIHGLRLSGALEPVPRGRGMTWRFRGKERAIEQDIKETPWWKAVGEPRFYRNGHGRRREVRISQFAAALVPPTDKFGPDVVAGLLAGSCTWIDRFGRSCLLVRKSDETESLLRHWSIVHTVLKEQDAGGGRNAVTSPFYGVLFSGRMPRHARQAMLDLKKPAGCPLLGVAMWQIALKGIARGCGMPFDNALPFGRKGRLWAWRHGYSMKTMRKLALDHWKLTCVYGGLRDEMLAWYRRAEAERERNVPAGELTSSPGVPVMPMVPLNGESGTINMTGGPRDPLPRT